jgi:hypothetical protein
MKCPGVHCPGCEDGAGWLAVVLALAGSAATAVAWVLDNVWMTLGVLAGAGAVTGAFLLAAAQLSRLLLRVMTPLTVRIGAERLTTARAAAPTLPLTAPRGVESRRWPSRHSGPS